MSAIRSLKFATGNKNKLREASLILGYEVEMADVGDMDEIQTVEVEELIRHKAKSAYDVMGQAVMVEDTGLSFDAWNGLPGALVKWFVKSVGDGGMVEMLANNQNRKAEAVCYVATFDGEKYLIASGKVAGSVATEPRGDGGFGWDTIFIPNGSDKTFGEMSPQEKMAFSMRRIAFENFKKALDERE